MGCVKPIAERAMFCRMTDFRRAATRYDRNAANFFAAVCIAATVRVMSLNPHRPDALSEQENVS